MLQRKKIILYTKIITSKTSLYLLITSKKRTVLLQRKAYTTTKTSILMLQRKQFNVYVIATKKT